MKRRLAIVGIVCLAVMPAVAVHDQEYAQASGVELLMFDDPSCPYCRRWHREVGAAYRSSQEGRRAPLRIVRFRGPLPEGITLAGPVQATPTFVLVQDRREIGRITGYAGADFFWSMLTDLLAKAKAGKPA